MEEQNRIPKMLEFLFGEAADAARQGASQRLLDWCQAFEVWLAERKLAFKPDATRKALRPWRLLLQHCHKMPWELRPADIEGHFDRMQAEGYSPSTIYNDLGIISNFYAWCNRQKVDPLCAAGFNPAAGVPRPKFQRYGREKLLSQGEVQALLGVLKRDNSALGRRDYAFFLARLRLGNPLKALRSLQWGQIEQDESGAWVRWRTESAPSRLPEEVWEAIGAYLAASGRLAEMQAETYIFAPLRVVSRPGVGNRAEDWNGGHCLTNKLLRASLRLYGRQVEIPEEKLTLQELRRTATRLRLDAGASLEEMQAFLDSPEVPRGIKYRLRKLPDLPPETGCGGERAENEPPAPVRTAKQLKPGEGAIHGFYARSHPEEEVQAVIAENIQGVQEEIRCLRTLARGLLEWQGAPGGRDAARLGEAYSQAVSRLAGMFKAKQRLAETEKGDSRIDRFLKNYNPCLVEEGKPPISREDWEKEALGGEPGLEDEIAALRFVMRKTYQLALETQEIEEYVRLVSIYGIECQRLVRLLKAETANEGRLDTYLDELFERAIKQVTKEWGLGSEDSEYSNEAL